MTGSAQQSNEAGVTARLKELIKNISTLIDNMPEDQQQSLLSLLA